MQRLFPQFLLPPTSSNYKETQQAGLLHVMLLATFLGALIAAFQNLGSGWMREATILFALALLCFVGFWLNQRHQIGAAGLILCVCALIAIDGVLFYGAGLYDDGIMALPIVMLCASFLFGQRGLAIVTVSVIASVIGLYFLELNGFSQPPYHSTPVHVSMLIVLLIVLAVILAVIRETWERHLRQLDESYLLTLEGWAKALEFRDGDTGEHTRRVIRLTVALARRLGCSEQEIADMERGAYLHDIGKMAIPDHILRKPGPLDAQEREIIKQHPALALRFISHIPFLQSATAIPYYHHENWDGTGYPNGLKGKEIPLAARLFTLVDHWDALSSDRPYRKAWAREKIISHISENSGKLYDPQIAQAFLEMVKQEPPSEQG